MKLGAEALRRFGTRCLAAVGVPEDEADLISSSLVEADARGIHSHGFMRLPIYVERLRGGLARPVAEITVERETATTALLDGHRSMGQVVATRAMSLAVEKARPDGIAAVAVKDSNHFGVTARYALMACETGMVGVAMSNTFPLMPAIGGAERVIGNNPLAVAAPSNNRYPLVLDMALSSVALGKILFARSKGEPIPDDWGVDSSGTPTTDPAEVLDGGFITPIAGPKGFGLALIVEVLTGVLSGGGFARDLSSLYDLDRPQSISHLMLAVDPARFVSPTAFKESVSRLSSQVKESRRAEGVEEVYLPGEREFRLEEERMRSGIPLEKGVMRELEEMASTLGVSLPEAAPS